MSSSTENEYIFETVDPRNNYISLSCETWEIHILAEKPYLAGEEKTVQEAIETPDGIYQDKDYSTTQIYIKRHKNIMLKPYGPYLKVPVNIESGTVKTAYCTFQSSEKTEKLYP